MGNTDAHITRARARLQQHVLFGGVPAVQHAGGSYPLFAARVDGCRFWDIEGREYVDWFGGGGPCMLGHRHPAVQEALRRQLEAGAHSSIPAALEIEVAERICAMVPGVEQVLLVKNGTDATSGAVRLARAVTGRDRILTNGYHGFQDWSMCNAPNALGIPKSIAALSHGYAFNDLERATEMMAKHGDEVAAIFCAPLQDEAPQPGFLQGLRELCDRHGALLVFDEVVTGFRVARGGMQELSGVSADVVCLGKALGNGMPIAAIAGPGRVMKFFRSFRYGMTSQREALSLAAANACLQVFAELDVPAHLERIGDRLRSGLVAAAREHDLEWAVSGMSHWPHLVLPGSGRLTGDGVRALFFETMQQNGVFVSSPRIWPTLAHGDAEVDRTIEVARVAMRRTRDAMAHGLRRHLDGPVYERHDRECNDEPNVVDWRHRAEPVPFVIAGMNDCMMTLDGSSTGADVVGEAAAEGVILAVHGEANGVATVAMTLTRPLTGDFRFAVDYRFLDWQPGNAVIDLVLALNNDGGGGHRSVSQSFTKAVINALHTTGSGGRLRFPCVADIDAGTLLVERRGGAWSAGFRCATDEVDLPVQAEPFDGPVRPTFRLRAVGKGADVRVAVAGITVENL